MKISFQLYRLVEFLIIHEYWLPSFSLMNQISLIILFANTLLNAQSHNENVTIEGSYTPQIKKSERLVKTPEMPKQEFNIPNYEVNTEDFFYNYKVELEPISPIQYTNNNKTQITNNFVKAGSFCIKN